MTPIGEIHNQMDLPIKVVVLDKTPSADGETINRDKGIRPAPKGCRSVQAHYVEDCNTAYGDRNNTFQEDIDTRIFPMRDQQ